MKLFYTGIICLLLSSCFTFRDTSFSVPSKWTLESYEIKNRYGQDDMYWLYYRDDYRGKIHIVFRPLSDSPYIKLKSTIYQYVDTKI